ncbi:hypothetical protein GE09DRAFT_1250899 [Coniochaeta sp. 2T2.1]|nr:hypothetical protein GE09DRAFT_1250899 [Coniochaeta sp. 2T2.1]
MTIAAAQSTDLGILEPLPTEITLAIIRAMDIRTALRFRQTNRRAYAVVPDQMEYRSVVKHAHACLITTLETGLAESLAFAHIHRPLLLPLHHSPQALSVDKDATQDETDMVEATSRLHRYRYMASAPLQTYDLSNSEKDGYLAAFRKYAMNYTKEEFLYHVKTCGPAQKLWEATKGWTIRNWGVESGWEMQRSVRHRVYF